MNNKIKKLELENKLSQIYSNNYIYSDSFCSFSFNCINFITINSLEIYSKSATINFQEEYLGIKVDKINMEIKYSDIDILLINFSED